MPDNDAALVAVQAAGIGAWDVQTTQGAFAGAGGMTTFPQVLGWDFTGTVAAVGASARDVAVGEAVLGFSPQPWTMAGAFAESIPVPAAGLARRPADLSVEQAAVLPVSALTADLAVRAAELDSTGSVLVLGAAGGVGSLIVQLARAAGATVVASVSRAQASAATGYGAALVIDRDRPVADQVLTSHGQVDAVIDLVGPAARPGVAAAIKDGGQFVTTVPYGDNPDERGIGVTTPQVMPDAQRLAELAQRAAAGQLRATIGAVVPFADAPARLPRSSPARSAARWYSICAELSGALLTLHVPAVQCWRRRPRWLSPHVPISESTITWHLAGHTPSRREDSPAAA